MNDDQKKLLIVFIISTFIADFPHPVLNLFGGQGTSKSTLSKMLIRITDPSKPPLLRMRGDGKELVQQLAHRWFPFYDNLTEISNGISNALCSAVTGDGESRRKLYTDQDDVILHYQPVIGLNGINLIPKRSDLLERSLLIHLKPIPKNLRKAEKEVWESFEQILPEILGTIFDVLSTALRLRESIILKSKPRMADFAEWGSAIALGMGWAEQDFLQLYEENVKLQYLEAVDADPAALAVSVIMLNREVWQGSPTDLLKEMRLVAEQEKIDTNHRHWPKAANKLKSRLNEAEASLASQGIIIEHDDASHGQRTFRLKKITISIAPIARKPEEQLVEDKKQETLEVQTEERPSYTEKVNKDLAAMKKQRSGGTGGTSPHTSSTSDANHV